MALSEITLRATNSSNSTNSGRGPRQTTLFDSLGAAQRRHKRTHKVSLDQENVPIENGSDGIAVKTAKRRRASPLEHKPTETLQLNMPKRPQNIYVKRPFAIHSSHIAQRIRQRQTLAASSVCTISRLASLVSPASSAFRLYADSEQQLGVLPLACKYSSMSMPGKLAMVDESGHISIFDTHKLDPDSEDSLEPVQRWKAHENSVFDIEWRNDSIQAVTASADETCRLWDVERQMCLGSFVGHSQTVRSVSWRPDDMSCFTTASRDGSIMMWDTRCNKISVDGEQVFRSVNIIERAHCGLLSSKRPVRGKRGITSGSVTCIRHLQHNPLLVASVGSTSEIVKFWDVRMRQQARKLLPTPVTLSSLASSSKRSRGTASLSLDSDGARLFSACNDNSVYVHNALLLSQPIARLAAPEFECQSFNVGTAASPCSRYLAAGSSNGNVVVWELDSLSANSSGRYAVLQGHNKEAGCIAWYPGKDRIQLATCGDDGVLRIWNEDSVLAEAAKTDPMRRCVWGFSHITHSVAKKNY
ncbi:WD40-repeat-containing domain protein [Coemansia mojavensis]|nr:WD40-repeat-containing domain protein [Coemansia mojavensis]KAJ1741288.1 hypothetical protein LPJ68_002999 [Coemansia sp. RSA 1086]